MVLSILDAAAAFFTQQAGSFGARSLESPHGVYAAAVQAPPSVWMLEYGSKASELPRSKINGADRSNEVVNLHRYQLTVSGVSRINDPEQNMQWKTGDFSGDWQYNIKIYLETC